MLEQRSSFSSQSKTILEEIKLQVYYKWDWLRIWQPRKSYSPKD